MNHADSLQVVVTWAGTNPPGSLTGYFVISPTTGSNQTAPSPFVNGNNYVCFLPLSANKSPNGQQYTFTSPFLTVPNNATSGNYELTLVVDSDGVQWSEDPEFDTTGN